MRLFFALVLLLSMTSFSALAKESAPRLNHVLVSVTDMERSIKFYQDAFGMEVHRRLTKLTQLNEDGTKQDIK